MTRRILLHIGSPKCGSTYLQQVLLQNIDRLASQGIAYPQGGVGHPGNAAHLAEVTQEKLDSWFADDVHTVILSHEDLYSQAKRGDTLAALIEGTGIKVQLICFLRPFSEFIYGDYSQFMKQFFDVFLAKREPYDGRDFKTFAQRRVDTMKPAAYLRQWQQRFPDQPLILAGHRKIRTVMSDLLGYPLADTLDWEVDSNRVNRSLRTEDCDCIAAAMRDPQMPNEVIKQMFRDSFHHVDDPDPGKTDERTTWIEAQFAPQNAILLEEFNFDNRRKS